MDGDSKATTTPTTGSNYQSCKHCNSTFIGLEEYAECPVCGQPFEEDANG
jgi:rubrerythrin